MLALERRSFATHQTPQLRQTMKRVGMHTDGARHFIIAVANILKNENVSAGIKKAPRSRMPESERL